MLRGFDSKLDTAAKQDTPGSQAQESAYCSKVRRHGDALATLRGTKSPYEKDTDWRASILVGAKRLDKSRIPLDDSRSPPYRVGPAFLPAFVSEDSARGEACSLNPTVVMDCFFSICPRGCAWTGYVPADLPPPSLRENVPRDPPYSPWPDDDKATRIAHVSLLLQGCP